MAAHHGVALGALQLAGVFPAVPSVPAVRYHATVTALTTGCAQELVAASAVLLGCAELSQTCSPEAESRPAENMAVNLKTDDDTTSPYLQRIPATTIHATVETELRLEIDRLKKELDTCQKLPANIKQLKRENAELRAQLAKKSQATSEALSLEPLEQYLERRRMQGEICLGSRLTTMLQACCSSRGGGKRRILQVQGCDSLPKTCMPSCAPLFTEFFEGCPMVLAELQPDDRQQFQAMYASCQESRSVSETDAMAAAMFSPPMFHVIALDPSANQRAMAASIGAPPPPDILHAIVQRTPMSELDAMSVAMFSPDGASPIVSPATTHSATSSGEMEIPSVEGRWSSIGQRCRDSCFARGTCASEGNTGFTTRDCSTNGNGLTFELFLLAAQPPGYFSYDAAGAQKYADICASVGLQPVTHGAEQNAASGTWDIPDSGTACAQYACMPLFVTGNWAISQVHFQTSWDNIVTFRGNQGLPGTGADPGPQRAFPVNYRNGDQHTDGWAGQSAPLHPVCALEHRSGGRPGGSPTTSIYAGQNFPPPPPQLPCCSTWCPANGGGCPGCNGRGCQCCANLCVFAC